LVGISLSSIYLFIRLEIPGDWNASAEQDLRKSPALLCPGSGLPKRMEL
jgi:hypothetical protein